MKNRLIVFLMIFTFFGAKAQFSNDSIIYVYFHKMADTIIKIDKEYDSLDKKYYFNLNKIFYDTNGVNPYYSEIIRTKTIKELDPLLDSLSKLNYFLGKNKSNFCSNTFKVRDFKKISSDKYGYVAEYDIKDIRLLNTDTIWNQNYIKNSSYFKNNQIHDIQIKKAFQQVSFAWSSKDDRMTFFWFQNLSTSIDKDGEEVVISIFKSNMKKQ